MRKSILTILCVIFIAQSFAQGFKANKLKIGDQVPDVVLGHFIQYPLKEKTFSDLKGKLVLLDFWTNTCTTCIQSMPHLDSLQKQIGDSLQIILITPNNDQEVKKVFSKVKIKAPELPIITSDTVFRKMFPFLTVPHHVWIDKDGKVKYIASFWNANASNIKKALKGEPILAGLKSEFTDINIFQPLWKEGNGRLSGHLISYSYFMNRVKEYGRAGAGWNRDSTGTTLGLKIENESLLDLYKMAFGKSHIFQGEFDIPNHILLKVKQPERFRMPGDEDPEKDQWIEENTYCYESSLPVERKAELYTMFQQDLNRFFPYNAYIQKRKVTCLVLVRTSLKDKFKTHGGKSLNPYKADTVMLRNEPIASLVTRLAYILSHYSYPVVDGTGYKANIDIELHGMLDDLPTLKAELDRYGLGLKKEIREINMLVIEDK